MTSRAFHVETFLDTFRLVVNTRLSGIECLLIKFPANLGDNLELVELLIVRFN